MSMNQEEEFGLVETLMENAVGLLGLKLLILEKNIATEEEIMNFEEKAYVLIQEASEQKIKEFEKEYIDKYGEVAYKEYIEPNINKAKDMINKER